MSRGGFAAVIGDSAIASVDGYGSTSINSDAVDRVILCSGKAYYELLAQRRKSGRKDVAIVRLEQLYPFPAEQLSVELAAYRNARVVVWAQEEAKNQGAWRYVAPELRVIAPAMALQYAGPAPAASTAPGSPAGHTVWQAELLRSAFED